METLLRIWLFLTLRALEVAVRVMVLTALFQRPKPARIAVSARPPLAR